MKLDRNLLIGSRVSSFLEIVQRVESQRLGELTALSRSGRARLVRHTETGPARFEFRALGAGRRRIGGRYSSGNSFVLVPEYRESFRVRRRRMLSEYGAFIKRKAVCMYSL